MNAVRGRIDHMDFDPARQIIFVAALGNNTLEVIDIGNSGTLHSITGLDEPQGVAYVPQQHEIFVANGGNGACYFYNTDNFQKTRTIPLGSDADDVRFDSSRELIYVGYGSGGIAKIDARTHQLLKKVSLPAHPESFQLDESTHKIFVNLPNVNQIAVIDADSFLLKNTWKRLNPSANFPMAVDPNNHHVIIGYRSPPALEIVDETGQSLNTYPMAGDADDLYYDDVKNRIYISGGDGTLNIFEMTDPLTCKQIAGIPTRKGARTSFFIPSSQTFIIASRASGHQGAALLVYKIIK
jgi:hypothetical protein